MIIRLLLLIALIVGVIAIRRWLRNSPPGQRRQRYWQLGLGLAAGLLLLLAVTGRIHWLGAIIAAALPFIQKYSGGVLRLSPLLMRWFQQHRRNQHSRGNQSRVDSACLHMVLDHDTNRLHGQVTQGPFSGRELDDLERSELDQLLDYCRQSDPDGVALLNSYLRHRFGDSTQDSQQSAETADGPLSRSEALAILGLADNACREDIIQAHRRLMQKLHPDRGGSDYLAARINAAKKRLLD